MVYQIITKLRKARKKEFDYIIYSQVKVMILHILFSDWVLILNECRRHILNTNLTFQPGLLEEEPGPGGFLKPNSKSVVSILKIWQFWNWFQKNWKFQNMKPPDSQEAGQSITAQRRPLFVKSCQLSRPRSEIRLLCIFPLKLQQGKRLIHLYLLNNIQQLFVNIYKSLFTLSNIHP